MSTNKERLEKLIEQIKRLEILTEEVRERDIYPVSFFSQAFDISNKIQDDLQQIEISQIELIERNLRAENPAVSIESALKQPPQLFSPQEMVAPEIVHPPHVQEMIVQTKTPPPVHQVQEEQKVKLAYLSERKNLIDLKKMLTLNDRFLFCRELFANNENQMNQVFSELNMEESYNAALDYLQKRFDWNFEDKNVTDFLAILKKRFT